MLFKASGFRFFHHHFNDIIAGMLLLAGGWTPVTEWSDANGDFSIVLAEAQPNRSAP